MYSVSFGDRDSQLKHSEPSQDASASAPTNDFLLATSSGRATTQEHITELAKQPKPGGRDGLDTSIVSWTKASEAQIPSYYDEIEMGSKSSFGGGGKIPSQPGDPRLSSTSISARFDGVKIQPWSDGELFDSFATKLDRDFTSTPQFSLPKTSTKSQGMALPDPDLEQCDGCGQHFSGSNKHSNLKRHLETVHGPLSLGCDVIGCDETFTRSDNLRAHMRSVHQTESDDNKMNITILNSDSERFERDQSLDSSGGKGQMPQSRRKDAENARQVRRVGACWQCRFQRKKCNLTTPCTRCNAILHRSDKLFRGLHIQCYRGDLVELASVFIPYANLEPIQPDMNLRGPVVPPISVSPSPDTIDSCLAGFTEAERTILKDSFNIAHTGLPKTKHPNLLQNAFACLEEALRLDSSILPQYRLRQRQRMEDFLMSLNLTLRSSFKCNNEDVVENWHQTFYSLLVLNIVISISSRRLCSSKQSMKYFYSLIVALFVWTAASVESLRGLIPGASGSSNELSELSSLLERSYGHPVVSQEDVLLAIFDTISDDDSNKSQPEGSKEYGDQQPLSSVPVEEPVSQSPAQPCHETIQDVSIAGFLADRSKGMPAAEVPIRQVATAAELSLTDRRQASRNTLSNLDHASMGLETPPFISPTSPRQVDLRPKRLRTEDGFSERLPEPLMMNTSNLQSLSPAREHILSLWQQIHTRMPTETELLALSVVTGTFKEAISYWFSCHRPIFPTLAAPEARNQTAMKDEPPLSHGGSRRCTCNVKKRNPKPWNKAWDEEKPYSCLCRCGWTFTKKGDWIKHEKINFPEHTFHCPVPDCRSNFRRKDKCRDHIRKVHKISQTEQFDLDSRRTSVAQDHNDRCGFCGHLCTSWQEWYDHVGAHFENRIEGGPWTMSMWRYPWTMSMWRYPWIDDTEAGHGDEGPDDDNDAPDSASVLDAEYEDDDNTYGPNDRGRLPPSQVQEIPDGFNVTPLYDNVGSGGALSSTAPASSVADISYESDGDGGGSLWSTAFSGSNRTCETDLPLDSREGNPARSGSLKRRRGISPY